MSGSGPGRHKLDVDNRGFRRTSLEFVGCEWMSVDFNGFEWMWVDLVPLLPWLPLWWSEAAATAAVVGRIAVFVGLSGFGWITVRLMDSQWSSVAFCG